MSSNVNGFYHWFGELNVSVCASTMHTVECVNHFQRNFRTHFISDWLRLLAIFNLFKCRNFLFSFSRYTLGHTCNIKECWRQWHVFSFFFLPNENEYHSIKSFYFHWFFCFEQNNINEKLHPMSAHSPLSVSIIEIMVSNEHQWPMIDIG